MTEEQNDFIAPPRPPHTYIGVAQSMLRDVQTLAAAPRHGLGLPFVAAQVLENLLKAYISRGGSDAEVTKHDVRHNLNALWALAVSQGLRVEKTPPDWVDILSGLHNRPFYLRYSTGVHGVVSPNARVMATGLAALLELVKEQIR